jgi:hypothetical protein
MTLLPVWEAKKESQPKKRVTAKNFFFGANFGPGRAAIDQAARETLKKLVFRTVRIFFRQKQIGKKIRSKKKHPLKWPDKKKFKPKKKKHPPKWADQKKIMRKNCVWAPQKKI